MKATRDDVIAYYEAILGRSPESEEIIQLQLAESPSRIDLARRFLNSIEFNRLASSAFGRFSFYNSEVNPIEVDLSEEQLTALLAHVRETWSQFGETEPHFSVLTNPAYRSENLTSARIGEFYATGADDAGAFFNACARNGLDARTSGTMVELGCGIGRVAEHLAPRYGNYIGVDISPSHLAAARRRAGENGVRNAEFMTLNAFLDAGTLEYDAAYSLIVLQHNPPPVMKYLLGKLLGGLRPDGVAFFQIPSLLFNYSFDLKDYLADAYRKNDMEMHALPQQYVFDVVEASGCRVREVIYDGKSGNLGFSYSYLVHKTPAPEPAAQARTKGRGKPRRSGRRTKA